MPVGVRAAASPRTLAREDVYHRLYEQIVDGTLAPGEVLHDKHLAIAFGVSRMPVREAFRRLEDEGLVETASNRWTRVAPLDIRKALEAYVVIEALESFALGLAFPFLTTGNIQELHKSVLHNSNVEMLRAARRGDAAATLAADDAFHDAWVNGSDNTELAGLIRQIKSRLRRIELVYFHVAGRVEQSYREHRKIMQAIRAFSLTDGTKALRHHWRGSARRIAVIAAGRAGPRRVFIEPRPRPDRTELPRPEQRP
jgi:DNA-binding GntR family transcriptional regulator